MAFAKHIRAEAIFIISAIPVANLARRISNIMAKNQSILVRLKQSSNSQAYRNPNGLIGENNKV